MKRSVSSKFRFIVGSIWFWPFRSQGYEEDHPCVFRRVPSPERASTVMYECGVEDGTYFFLGMDRDTNDTQGFIVSQRMTFALLPDVQCPRKFRIEILRALRTRWVSGGEFGNRRLSVPVMSRPPEVHRFTNVVASLTWRNCKRFFQCVLALLSRPTSIRLRRLPPPNVESKASER